MVKIKRWLRHAFMPPWRWRLAFPVELLDSIELAIKASETAHNGELRFAIENTLPLCRVWQGLSARKRADEVFSYLRVWDTEENCGVLIYLMLADKEVHILADRGINKRVSAQEWAAIAQTMQTAFSAEDFKGGSLSGINLISQLLCKHFPASAARPNELPNRPVILNR